MKGFKIVLRFLGPQFWDINIDVVLSISRINSLSSNEGSISWHVVKMKRHLLQIFGGSLDMKLLFLVGIVLVTLVRISMSLSGSHKTPEIYCSRSWPHRKTLRCDDPIGMIRNVLWSHMGIYTPPSWCGGFTAHRVRPGSQGHTLTGAIEDALTLFCRWFWFN